MSAAAVRSISPMLEAALELAELGYPVFPLRPGRKEPATGHGFKDATKERDVIVRWWSSMPEAGIGLPMGEASGLVVVDVDPRNGGPATRDELVDVLGPIPSTVVEVLSGGGGRHLYFKVDDRNYPSQLGRGIDVKASGYVVAPPSGHPSGGVYSWDGARGAAALRDVPVMPSVWLEVARARGPGRPRSVPMKLERIIPDGQKHHTIVSLAGTCRFRGMSEDVAFAACRALPFQSPVSDEDILKRVRDVYARYEAGDDHAGGEDEVGGDDHVGEADWKSGLLRGKGKNGELGPIQANLHNVIHALRHCPAWAGKLGYNEFTYEAELLTPAPWGGAVGPWKDHEDRLLAAWLQAGGINVTSALAGEGAQVVARDRRFHPVREWLDGLLWDGVSRVDSWAVRYLGAEDSLYHRTVGRKFLVSMIARIFEPGSKTDHVLVLEGPQGAGKSAALRALGEPWFCDELADMGNKDASLQLRGVWLVELAELSSMARSEVERVKAFISRQTDRYRPPYGRHLIEQGRHCVFAGSTNKDSYLSDETGARRFWPVRCGPIDVAGLRRDRDQLLAEAAAAYRDGAVWWFDVDDAEVARAAAEEQADRLERDPWEPVIRRWLDGRLESHTIPVDCVTTETLLSEALGKDRSLWTRADRIRVGFCLKAMGWERKKVRLADGFEWRYFRPGSEGE